MDASSFLRLCAARIRLFLGGLYVALLLVSLFFQYGLGTAPCLICLLQRLILILLLWVMVLHHGCHWSRMARFYFSVSSVLVLLGAALCVRHIWLQLSPAQVAGEQCLPELSVILRYMSWQNALEMMSHVAGACHKMGWRWLGLSLPMWLLVFYGFCLMALGLEYRMAKRAQV